MLKDKILAGMSVLFMVFGLAIVELSIMPAIIGLGLIAIFGVVFIAALYNLGFLSDMILVSDEEKIAKNKTIIYEFPQYTNRIYESSNSFAKRKIA